MDRDVLLAASPAVRALVVDDSDASRLMMARQLQALVQEVALAASGEDALALDGLASCGLAFIDLQLPGMSGAETARALRGRGLALPIYGMSIHVTAEETSECLAAGMTALLPKPLRASRLQGLVRLAAEFSLHADSSQNTAAGALQNTAAGALPAAGQEAPIFDQKMALAQADGRPDLVEELMAAFMQGLDEDQQKINAATADLAALAREVHRLRGALSYCGLPRLQQAAAALEAAIQGKDSARALALVHRLNGEMAALRNWYRQMVGAG